MSKIPKTNGWAVAIACLALAVAGNALAQNQQSQDEQAEKSKQKSSSQQASQQDRQNASQSDSQKSEHAGKNQQKQQKQQSGQRDQQASQRKQGDQAGRQSNQRDQYSSDQSQQSRQRDQQSQRDESQWDRERSERGQQDWPQPNRSQFGRDSERFDRDSDRFSSDSQRSAQKGGEGGLGVSIQEDSREGLVIQRVHRGSPAEEMGLETGDRITHVNGQEVQSSRQFISEIRNMNPGDEVEIDVRRDRDQLTLRGELESRDEALVLRGSQRGGQYSSRENWQTSYDEQRAYSQGRSGQMSSGRIEQIERQVDQLSRELDNLRFALQDIRRQSGQPGQSGQQGRLNRETTARYDEYQSRTIESPRRSGDRWDDTNRFRQADRNRGVGRSGDYDGGQSLDGARRSQSGQRDQPRQYESDSDRSGQYDSGQDSRRDSQNDSSRSSQRSRQSDRDEDRDSPGGEIGDERLRTGADNIRQD